MASELKTRSGLMPNETALPYSITTSKVESYLQSKVDVLLNRMAEERRKRREKRDDDDEDLPVVNVKVYTTEAGKSFLPFVVILPTDVLEQKNKNTRKKMASIFDTKNEDGTANMRKEFYELFKSYVYNKSDEEAFFSDVWRRERHVSRETSPVLKSLRTPKITSMDNGKLQVVSFMIDPIRVFHDMLVSEDDRRNFKIEVVNWQKIQTGEYRYDIKRVINKGKNKQKYKDTLAAELNRKMLGRR